MMLSDLVNNSEVKNITFKIDDIKFNNFDNIIFTNCVFEKVNFSVLQFNNLQFIKCEFVDCLFDNLIIRNCIFKNSKLTNINFLLCDIKKTLFEDSKLVYVDFNSGIIVDSDLSICNVFYIFMNNTFVKNVKFFNNDIETIELIDLKAQDLDLCSSKIKSIKGNVNNFAGIIFSLEQILNLLQEIGIIIS